MMPTHPHADEEWEYARTLLPEELEASAKKAGALVRARGVPSAEALARLCIAYGVTDLSLKDVAAWARASGVARVSGPGLFYRIVAAEAWLEELLAEALRDEVTVPGTRHLLRVVDATVVTGPKSEGTDWRAHVLVDPASGGMRRVEITDCHGGEGLARHGFRAGEVVLGDRAYATAHGMWAVVSAGAHVLVRMNLHTLRICDARRRPVSLFQAEKRLPKVGVQSFEITIPVPPDRTRATKSHKRWKTGSAMAWISARAIACRTRANTVLWVVTTVPQAELGAVQALELYRLRWQIELLFKRLKSILGLSELRTRAGPTARSWLLARFLAAALAQKLVRPAGPLSPWGYRLHEAGAAT
jgi:hypothetical protein